MRTIMQRGGRSTALLVIGIVAGALISTTATVLAAIPDSTTGVITACYKASTGAIRVIDAESGQACSKSEAALAWNQVGPQGPAGQDGEAGAQGPEGPAGPDGVTDLAISETYFDIAPGEWQASVECPATMEATGGGYQITAVPIDYQQPVVLTNGPVVVTDQFGTPSTTGWFIEAFNGTSGTNSINGYLWAICVETGS